MELDPFDERELYNKYSKADSTVSTTISTIIVQGGPLQLVIALLRVSTPFVVASQNQALNGFNFNADLFCDRGHAKMQKFNIQHNVDDCVMRC